MLLLGTALAAWIVTVGRMRGMDAGPGTDLGGLGWFLGIWLTMTAAMMLPSSALMVARLRQGFADGSDRKLRRSATSSRGPRTARRLGVYRLVEGAGFSWLALGSGGAYVAGAAIAAAGLYQLTPLKQACLRHCRGPLRYVVHGWREGRSGAVRMGLEHGPTASAAAGG